MTGIEQSRQVPTQELCALAERLYADLPPLSTLLQRLRPHICPFEILIDLVPPGSSVLDVGCGAGLFLGLLAGSGKRIDGRGFDCSGRAVGNARLMASASERIAPDSRLSFECSDAGDEWPEGLFNVVCIIDVLHHISPAHQKSVLLQCMAKLRPGGILICKEMAPESAIHALWNRMHDLVVARDWIHYIRQDALREWVREGRCAIVRDETHTRLLYRHNLLVAKRV